MQILKSGNKNVKLFTCHDCGCIFEEEIEKCSKDEFKDILGDYSGDIYYCRCPECGCIVKKDCTFDARLV